MIIYASKQDEMNIAEEVKQEWLHEVLIALGADAEIIKENTLEAKNHISALGLDVIAKPFGEIDIIRYDYEQQGDAFIEKDNYLVAQWFKPEYILKKENGEEFYEIHVEEWALPFQMESLGE